MTVIDATDRLVIPFLGFLADWSIRWALLLTPVLALLALRTPRRAVSRLWLCGSAAIAGLLLPTFPRGSVATVSLPSPWPASRVADRVQSRAAGSVGPLTSGNRAEVSPEAKVAVPMSRIAVASGKESDTQPPTLDAKPAGTLGVDHPNRIHVRGVGEDLPVKVEHERSQRLGPWRLAALVLTAAWGAGVGFYLLRFLCGRSVLRGLRREAGPVAQGSIRLLDECRKALKPSRAVKLGVHPAVSSPVVLGCRMPLILVPVDWESWREVDRRACLIHELGHLAWLDDLTKLAQEILRIPFFFHPLVSRLLGRMDREREMCCDEMVVALGIDPVGYAGLLLELGRRPGRLLPGRAWTRPGWLPFLDRGSVAIRIARILEDDMSGKTVSRPPSRWRHLGLSMMALLVAAGIGGLRVRALEPQGPGAVVQRVLPQAKAGSPRQRIVSGLVTDADGQSVPGADVVCAIEAKASHREVGKTDANGEYAFALPEGPVQVHVYAYKPGFAPSAMQSWLEETKPGERLNLQLPRPEPFSATLIDRQGKPVAGAKVRIEMVATRPVETKNARGGIVTVCFEHVRPTDLSVTPLEPVYSALTDARGRFTIEAAPPGGGLRFVALVPKRGTMRIDMEGLRGSSMMKDHGIVPREATAQPLVVFPAAKVSGRVSTRLPGVGLSGLTVFMQGSRARGRQATSADGQTTTDDEGRFGFDGLDEGTVNIMVSSLERDVAWTYRAAKDVALRSGETAEVTIELIRGVEVEGKVVTRGTGRPVEKVQLGVYGPFRPRSGAATVGALTDAQGRFRYRLPPGETYVYVMGPPPGFKRLPEEGSSRTFTIPQGVTRFEAPPIELEASVALHGRVVDAKNIAVAAVSILGVSQEGFPRFHEGFGVPMPAVTDDHGEFQPAGSGHDVVPGREATVSVRLGDGREFDVKVVPTADGSATVRLPVAALPRPGATAVRVEGPRDVAPDELAGIVVDASGNPLQGVEVDAWTWYPGNETRTDSSGSFRLGKLDQRRKVEVRFRKEGYSPQVFLEQLTGTTGWVIVLGKTTFFEGTATGRDGKPVAGALIRANQGPKRSEGSIITDIWTEARTDAEGRYRMYAQADDYQVLVRVPGAGVARLDRVPLLPDEAKTLDIRLEAGVDFRGRMVDSLSGRPVARVRLWHWQYPDVEGRSDTDGMVRIADMLPGRFSFQVDSSGHARWWSEEGATPRSRRQFLARGVQGGDWQGNYQEIDFDLSAGMDPVTITVEPAVIVAGRVLDPDSKPVAGAMVSPIFTGSDSSAVGSGGFDVVSDRDGRFRLKLPASGQRSYHLMAHEGRRQQWRTWANGVSPSWRTRPGQEIRDVDVRLTRPAAVRGRVVDPQGMPVADCVIRSRPMDRMEWHLYGPETKTDADGRYELRFLRPVPHSIWAGNNLYFGEVPSDGSARDVTARADRVTDGVDLVFSGSQ
jgi:protocatechuate 3,4-dioxygenase beta subunit